MQIELKLDSNGHPYLQLKADGGSELENKALEIFIERAREKGIVIKNEASLDHANYYASIRVKGDNHAD